jgi:hypothetical protein
MADAPEPRNPKELDIDWDEDSLAGSSAPKLDGPGAAPNLEPSRPKVLSPDEVDKLSAKFRPSWEVGTDSAGDHAGSLTPLPSLASSFGSEHRTPPGGLAAPTPAPLPAPAPDVPRSRFAAEDALEAPPQAPQVDAVPASPSGRPLGAYAPRDRTAPEPWQQEDTSPGYRKRAAGSIGTDRVEADSSTSSSVSRPMGKRQWAAFAAAACVGAVVMFGVMQLAGGPSEAKNADSSAAPPSGPAPSAQAEALQPVPLESIPVPIDSLPPEAQEKPAAQAPEGPGEVAEEPAAAPRSANKAKPKPLARPVAQKVPRPQPVAAPAPAPAPAPKPAPEPKPAATRPAPSPGTGSIVRETPF